RGPEAAPRRQLSVGGPGRRVRGAGPRRGGAARRPRPGGDPPGARGGVAEAMRPGPLASRAAPAGRPRGRERAAVGSAGLDPPDQQPERLAGVVAALVVLGGLDVDGEALA